MFATLLKDMSFSAVTLKHMACAQTDVAQLYLADTDALEEHPKTSLTRAMPHGAVSNPSVKFYSED